MLRSLGMTGFCRVCVPVVDADTQGYGINRYQCSAYAYNARAVLSLVICAATTSWISGTTDPAPCQVKRQECPISKTPTTQRRSAPCTKTTAIASPSLLTLTPKAHSVRAQIFEEHGSDLDEFIGLATVKEALNSRVILAWLVLIMRFMTGT